MKLGLVNWRNLLLIGAGAFVVAISGFYFAKRLVGAAFEAEHTRFRTVTLGMTETQVRALLDEPYKLYAADRSHTFYYISGYSCPSGEHA